MRKDVYSKENGRGIVFVFVVPLRSLPSMGTKTKKEPSPRLAPLFRALFARFHSRYEASPTQSMRPFVEGAPSWERRSRGKRDEELHRRRRRPCPLTSTHQNSFSLFLRSFSSPLKTGRAPDRPDGPVHQAGGRGEGRGDRRDCGRGKEEKRREKKKTKACPFSRPPLSLSLTRCFFSPSTLSKQEFNIEKLTLLDAEKARVAREFERRDAAVEVKKKM